MLRILPALAAAAAALSVCVSVPSTAAARGVLPPANDDIADATSLHAGDDLNQTTVGATRESTDPANLRGQHTVWYVIKASNGAPLEVATEVENGGMAAYPIVYSGEPGDLTTVVRGHGVDPGVDFTHEYARFDLERGETYYLGIAGGQDGSPFDLSLYQAKQPTSLTFAGSQTFGDGRPQLYTEDGEHPRVTVVVRTGFPGHRKPARGPVVLQADGERYRTVLQGGRATFVLPRIRHDYELIATYRGTAKVDRAVTDAYMNRT